MTYLPPGSWLLWEGTSLFVHFIPKERTLGGWTSLEAKHYIAHGKSCFFPVSSRWLIVLQPQSGDVDGVASVPPFCHAICFFLLSLLLFLSLFSLVLLLFVLLFLLLLDGRYWKVKGKPQQFDHHRDITGSPKAPTSLLQVFLRPAPIAFGWLARGIISFAPFSIAHLARWRDEAM